MNIALFIPDLAGGGAQHMIVNMANEFARRGNKVDLILIQQDGAYKKIIKPNVNIICLNQNRTIQALPKLISYLKNSQPDIFLSAMYHVNLVAILAKLMTPGITTRFVITERNFFSLKIKDSNQMRDKFLPLLVRMLYRFADEIVAISKGVAQDISMIAKLHPNKVKCIYNPVITSKTLAALNENNIESPLAPQSDKVIIASGRLVPQKDYITLLHAFSKLLQKENATLIILGEGDLRSDLEKLTDELKISNKVSFKGFVDNPLSYMKKADLFVLSSQWEGFGNVLVEALICGLPIVSTDCPAGPSEILEGGKYGTLVEVGNVDALAQAMKDKLHANHHPETQTKRALCFSVEKICDQYEELFLNTIGRTA
ncbi:MAG: glycosyltransferase [Alphaproteobacteria bacterium]|nr:glycosyltransferase [Alphaproteobacteria bacterium]